MDKTHGDRGASRFLAGLPGVLHSGQGDFACDAHDLSRSGVMLEGRFPLPGRTAVEVTLRTPASDLELRLKGQVVREGQVPGEDEKQIALTFSALDARDRDVLEQLISRVVEGMVPAPIRALPPGASPNEIRAALERVPVPHRMTLATRGQVQEREILAHDTNLQVLDALLRNPNLNPPEVERLLRVPALLPSTLEAVARSRWGAVEQIQLLLVIHRNTPAMLADRLISDLGPAARQRALQSANLPATIRSKLLKK